MVAGPTRPDFAGKLEEWAQEMSFTDVTTEQVFLPICQELLSAYDQLKQLRAACP